MTSSICTKCKLEKPVSEFHLLHGKPKHRCKECANAARRTFRANNREKERESTNRYYQNNREQELEKKKRHRRANREAYAEASKKKYQNRTPEERARARELKRQWYARLTPEQRREYQERYKLVRADAESRRRARKKGAEIEPINRSQIIERDGSTCYLCGSLLTVEEVVIDHVVPLARGGSHTASNLRVACRKCNLHKGSMPLEEFLKSKQ